MKTQTYEIVLEIRDEHEFPTTIDIIRAVAQSVTGGANVYVRLHPELVSETWAREPEAR